MTSMITTVPNNHMGVRGAAKVECWVENVQKISLQDPSAKSKHCNRKPSNDAEKGILFFTLHHA